MKLYKVTFNDGQWHTGELPSRVVIAESEESACELASKLFPLYNSWDKWAEEVVFPGYEISITKK